MLGLTLRSTTIGHVSLTSVCLKQPCVSFATRGAITKLFVERVGSNALVNARFLTEGPLKRQQRLWTAKENVDLRRLRADPSLTWNDIAATMGCTAASCEHRCNDAHPSNGGKETQQGSMDEAGG